MPAVATALVYTNRSLAALLLLLLCLPAAANFYIVVSQDVVTVCRCCTLSVESGDQQKLMLAIPMEACALTYPMCFDKYYNTNKVNLESPGGNPRYFVV